MGLTQNFGEKSEISSEGFVAYKNVILTLLNNLHFYKVVNP